MAMQDMNDQVQARLAKLDKFKDVIEATKGRVTPLWLEADKENAKAKVTRMSVKDDLDYEVEETFIVELYSK